MDLSLMHYFHLIIGFSGSVSLTKHIKHFWGEISLYFTRFSPRKYAGKSSFIETCILPFFLSHSLFSKVGLSMSDGARSKQSHRFFDVIIRTKKWNRGHSMEISLSFPFSISKANVLQVKEESDSY